MDLNDHCYISSLVSFLRDEGQTYATTSHELLRDKASSSRFLATAMSRVSPHRTIDFVV